MLLLGLTTQLIQQAQYGSVQFSSSDIFKRKSEIKLILVAFDLRQHIYIIVICPYATTTKLSQKYFALYFFAVFHTCLNSHQPYFKCLETTESSRLQYWTVQL